MNEVIKITAKALPCAQRPQLPLPIPQVDDEPLKAYPPEFWLSFPTAQQLSLIKEFENKGLEYPSLGNFPSRIPFRYAENVPTEPKGLTPLENPANSNSYWQ